MDPNEEVICGFTVSKQRKAVWNVELEMLGEFVKICNDNGLKYFASGGTLLGAVRHEGFIPWDDDVDIMMPRDDYNRFIEIAQPLLPDKYFLQSYKTEVLYASGHIQIRNNETTCLLKNTYYNLAAGQNCGIFIDIFPFDFVPDDLAERQCFAKKISDIKQTVRRKLYEDMPDSALRRIVKKIYCLLNKKKIEMAPFLLERVVQKYKDATNSVALFSFVPGYEKNVWKKSWFDERINVKFMNMEIAIPKMYDEVLRTEYGDYMVIPQDKSNGNMHGTAFFDTERSYVNYKNLTNTQIVDIVTRFEL